MCNGTLFRGTSEKITDTEKSFLRNFHFLSGHKEDKKAKNT